jgi:sulfite reductase (ferredoxin)
MVDHTPRAAAAALDNLGSQPPRPGDPFMIRCNIPGGRLTAEQYLLLDELATSHMHGSLRITARYNLQLHGVLADDVQSTVRRLALQLRPLLRASDAAGRPIMACPTPAVGPTRAAVDVVARQLSAHLLGRAMPAYEIWCGGEKIADSQVTAGDGPDSVADTGPSIHFKIGIAAPGDNCIDVYTHDLGLVPVTHRGALCGFNILVGGSMGMARQTADASPRLGECLGFVTPQLALPVIDKILGIDREAAARAGRQRGRFKHLLAAWGVSGLRHELERRLGAQLCDTMDVPPADVDLHLGWHPQGNDRWYLGLSVENGRIHDQGALHLRQGLREIVARFRPGLCLTPNQDLLLTELSAADRPEVESRLRACGIPWPDELSTVRRYAMACPARPSCGHAVAEAERLLPTVVGQLEAVLADLGLEGERLSIRMNGCSFGCTRPYVADVAFVGDVPDCYGVYLGGRSDGSRVNWLFKAQVPAEALVETVRPLFAFFKRARLPGEGFGDFCMRVGREVLLREGYEGSDEDCS